MEVFVFIENNVRVNIEYVVSRKIKQDLRYFLGVVSGELKNNYLDFSLDDGEIKTVYFTPDIFSVNFYATLFCKNIDKCTLNIFNSGKNFDAKYYFPDIESFDMYLYTWATYMKYNRINCEREYNVAE